MSKQSGRGRVAGLPEWDRCAVMGVVNVTPDSFSDGGRWFDTTAAVKHGLALVEEGADLVDVGGESTRPGATRVDEDEELRRVIPVVRGLASEGVTVSVDTMRASVAEQALVSGAALVNDVSGGLADPAMIPVVADAGAPFVVMHWRGFLEGGNVKGVYADVVAEVVDELHARVDAVLAGGISADRVVVDPGLGFSKDAEHDLVLLSHLDRLLGLGHPSSSPPPASGSSAVSSPVRKAPHRPRASATPPRPPSPPSRRTPARGRCACTRCARRRTRYGSPAPWKEPGERPPHRRGTGGSRQHRLLRGAGAR